jgi:FkbM family methyltransferase
VISATIFERAIFPREAEAAIVGEFLGTKPGFFVDVGANDPRDGSQTWHLEQDGWTGILIEPQPELAERLRKDRRAEVVAVACSSPANSGRLMEFYCAGPMSSLERGWTDTQSVVRVPVRSLDEVLTAARSRSPIDFLSIDVEGHGLQVLQGISLDRWRPRLILLEDHVMNLRAHRHLTANGYRWIRRSGLNSWYVPADDAAVSAFGRLQFLRKYYLALPFRHAREALRRMRQRLHSLM